MSGRVYLTPEGGLGPLQAQIDLALPPTGIDTGTDVRKEAWGLSPVGNWTGYDVDANVDDDYTDASDLAQTRTHNLVNELTGISEQADPAQTAWADPAYDARGNMTTIPKPSDLTSTYAAAYDSWNRLIEVKAGENVVVTYLYDGTNRRIRKVVEGDPDETFDAYYRGWQQLEIRKDSDADPYEQYVYSIRYVHSPVCRFADHDTDGQNVETLYYANDANFNVTALINTDGSVAERYIYDPYVKVTIWNSDWTAEVSWANSKKNPVLFTGYRLDPETGLYFGCNRYYHPFLGIWITRDPEEYVDGTNVYQYVVSEPISSTDAAGL